MKKQTKLEKRRKTVLGVVLGFGAVALLTTATATYIISVNKPSGDVNGNVTVDTIKGDFVELKIGTTSADLNVNLAESGKELPSDSYAVGYDSSIYPDGGNPIADLEITLPDITLTYGTDWAGADSPTLQFTLDPAKNAANQLQATDAKVEGVGRGSGPWTYVNAPDAKSITETSGMVKTTDGGTTTWTITGLKVSFQWGTFFDRKSPATFYNSKFYKADDTGSSALDGQPIGERKELTVETAGQILEEINAMKQAFETGGAGLVLTVTAVDGRAGA